MTPRKLIIGPAWVGDMVMAQSLFKLLKAQQPQCEIDVLAPQWTRALLNRMPQVSHAIAMPLNHGELGLRTRYQLAQTLRDRDYAQAIVLPNSFKSALMPWFAAIPQRTGWRGEWRYGLLNDIRHLDKQRYPLMIEQMMALGLCADMPLPTPYPYPELFVCAESQARTRQQLQLEEEQRPILALGVGAAYGSSKRWPASAYAIVAQAKLAEGWAVWLFGSKDDRPIAAEVMRLTQSRCVDVAGLTDLSGTIDLLACAAGVITNDSGLMHIACALKKPVIAIYGSTSPQFTPPLSQAATILKLDLPCQPCFKRECPLTHHACMRDLSPAHVLAAMTTWGVQAIASQA